MAASWCLTCPPMTALWPLTTMTPYDGILTSHMTPYNSTLTSHKPCPTVAGGALGAVGVHGPRHWSGTVDWNAEVVAEVTLRQWQVVRRNNWMTYGAGFHPSFLHYGCPPFSLSSLPACLSCSLCIDQLSVHFNLVIGSLLSPLDLCNTPTINVMAASNRTLLNKK